MIPISLVLSLTSLLNGCMILFCVVWDSYRHGKKILTLNNCWGFIMTFFGLLGLFFYLFCNDGARE